jgi:hypothetical protein
VLTATANAQELGKVALLHDILAASCPFALKV